ncbi:hypothetical protein EU245_14275 [Lentibacillus lipolyticus]|nr:hypothetical protein EU245_14275 [Lentibacillus lipolyticus]
MSTDPKIIATLEMLEQGKTQDDIVEFFGYKNWKSVSVYFYRRGYRWDGETFVLKDEEDKPSAVDEAKFLNNKAGQILRQLTNANANIRQIAIKNGFETVDEMGEYMKGQGYTWNSKLENYEYNEQLTQKNSASKPVSSQQVTDMKEYQSLLDFLLVHQEKLFGLLEEGSNGTLPRYKFRGGKANKTLGLPTSVQTLLSDFSKDYNVTQRDIIEVALAEFFKKYGYEEQLNSVLLS